MPVIGTGGFGKVYKYTLASRNTLAIKDEIKVCIMIYLCTNCASVVVIQSVSNYQW